MDVATPPSPEQLYDGTISAAWRLATCLHRETRAAEEALIRAYGTLAHDWPADLHTGRRRLLAIVCDQAGPHADATPAA